MSAKNKMSETGAKLWA